MAKFKLQRGHHSILKRLHKEEKKVGKGKLLTCVGEDLKKVGRALSEKRYKLSGKKCDLDAGQLASVLKELHANSYLQYKPIEIGRSRVYRHYHNVILLVKGRKAAKKEFQA